MPHHLICAGLGGEESLPAGGGAEAAPEDDGALALGDPEGVPRDEVRHRHIVLRPGRAPRGGGTRTDGGGLYSGRGWACVGSDGVKTVKKRCGKRWRQNHFNAAGIPSMKASRVRDLSTLPPPHSKARGGARAGGRGWPWRRWAGRHGGTSRRPR